MKPEDMKPGPILDESALKTPEYKAVDIHVYAIFIEIVGVFFVEASTTGIRKNGIREGYHVPASSMKQAVSIAKKLQAASKKKAEAIGNITEVKQYQVTQLCKLEDYDEFCEKSKVA
jgi:hypothetical protein